MTDTRAVANMGNFNNFLENEILQSILYNVSAVIMRFFLIKKPWDHLFAEPPTEDT